MCDDSQEHFKDFKWALGLNRLSLRVMGVWPGDKVTYGLRGLIVNLRVPFMILTLYVCLILPQMYALSLIIHEFPLVIDNLMTSCPTITCSIKLFFIWHSKQALQPVIESALQDWMRSPKRPWEYEVMYREASRGRIFTISGYAIVAGCYASFALAPLFGFKVRMISNITDVDERPLLVQSYYPYDYAKSPNYELTQGSQLFAAIFISMSMTIPDNYFVALVFHASAQFEILGKNLEIFIGEHDKSLSTERDREYTKKLGAFVDRHVHLMRIVIALENSFGFVIVAQILCMGSMICCLGFEILGIFENSGDDKPSSVQVLTLILNIFTLMAHTLIDCFVSETLALRSTGILYKIYNSKWYTISGQRTKDLIPMMIVSKNSRHLTVGKVLPLSIETYCSILKSIAGYISVLISVNKG